MLRVYGGDVLALLILPEAKGEAARGRGESWTTGCRCLRLKMRKKQSAQSAGEDRDGVRGRRPHRPPSRPIHVIAMLTTRSNVTSGQNTSSISGC